MAGTLVSKLIQNYESASGPGTGLEAHLSLLASIGGEFVTPNNIAPEDLDRLARSLGNLLKLLKKQNAKSENITMVKKMIAQISSIATKKISQRKPETNEYLLDLGDQLVNLRQQLSMLLGTAIIATLIDYSYNF